MTIDQGEIQGKAQLSRRGFLGRAAGVLSLPLLGGLGLSFSLRPKEVEVLVALTQVWTKEWESSFSYEASDSLRKILSILREDKRGDLLLALKLLGFAPTCYLLTGFFRPWGDEAKTKKVLERWRFSKRSVEKELYSALTTIMNSSYYQDQRSWKEINYPGPPDFVLIEKERG